MKFKLNFGKGGLKGFVVQHAEKAIFGMVLILVAAFIYSSATQKAVEEGESPNSLKGSAGSALNSLQTGNPWAAIGPERQGKIGNYPMMAGIARQPVDDAAYRGPTPWIRDLIPRQQKRQDPEIYAPSNVEAKAGVFAFMMRATRPDDIWIERQGRSGATEGETQAQAKEGKKASPWRIRLGWNVRYGWWRWIHDGHARHGRQRNGDGNAVSAGFGQRHGRHDARLRRWDAGR